MSTTNLDSKSKYIEQEYGTLVGAKIVAVRPMTDGEQDTFGWSDGYSSEVPFVIILDDGRALIPSMDSEGNGAGHVFVERVGK
jgi:hypothetical protein